MSTGVKFPGGDVAAMEDKEVVGGYRGSEGGGGEG